MKHYVFTRAVYDPTLWPVDATRRRLDIFKAVTVASLHAQSGQFEWVLAVHPQDPYLRERLETSQATPVFCESVPDRDETALLGYEADWPRDGTLTTRLDDDDAFTGDAVKRIQRAAKKHRGKNVLVFPWGIRVWGGRYTKVQHRTNAMSTLSSNDGSIVYDFRHREMREYAPVKLIDQNIAWLWVRHQDSLSGYKKAVKPITDNIKNLFPVDWAALPTVPVVDPQPGGTLFR